MPKTTADELLDFLLIFPPLLYQYYLGVVLICFVHTCIIPICLDHKCSITKQAFLSYFTALALRIEYSTKIGFKLRPHRRGSEHLYPLDRGAPPCPAPNAWLPCMFVHVIEIRILCLKKRLRHLSVIR